MFEGFPQTPTNPSEGADFESHEKETSLVEKAKEKRDSLLQKLPNPSSKAKAFIMSGLAVFAMSTEQAQADQVTQYSSPAESGAMSQLDEKVEDILTPAASVEEIKERIEDEQFLNLFNQEQDKVMELAFSEEDTPDEAEIFEHREASISLNEGYSFKEEHEGSLPDTLESVRLEASSYMTDITSSSKESVNDFSGFADVLTIEHAEAPESYESISLQPVGFSYSSREEAVLDALRNGAESVGVLVDNSSNLEAQDEVAAGDTLQETTASHAEAHVLRYEVDEDLSETQDNSNEPGLHMVRLNVEYAVEK